MICRNCGRENEPGDKFCAVCGAILDVPVEPAPAVPVETPEAPVVPAPEAPYVPAAAPEAPYVPPAAPKASYAPAAEVPYAPAAPEMPYGAPEMPYMPPVGAPDPVYAAPDPAYAAPMGVPAPGFAAPKKKALNFTFSFKMILKSHRCSQSSCAKKIMPASMSRAAFLHGFLKRAHGLLAHSGKSIILPQKAYRRMSCSPSPLESGAYSRKTCLNSEALVFKDFDYCF